MIRNQDSKIVPKTNKQKKAYLVNGLYSDHILPISSLDIDTNYRYSFSKRLELKIDGSPAVQVDFGIDEFNSILVDSTKKWSSDVCVITQIIISDKFTFATASYDLSLFGDGAALTNGISIGYKLANGFRNELFSNAVIQSNSDFFSIMNEPQIVAGVNKQAVVSASWPLSDICPPGQVMDLGVGDVFFALVQDDLSGYASISDLNMRVQGFGWVNR